MSAAGGDSARAPGPTPVAAVRERASYAVPKPQGSIELHLDGNEGIAPPAALLDALGGDAELLRRYPSTATLARQIADRLEIAADRVLVTGGGDDAIDRVCRAMLPGGRQLILPIPTFEMIERYAQLAGGEIVRVPWLDGPYPTDEVVARVGERTALIAVVSPNNPTGAVASAEALATLAAAAPHALLLVDLAYVEFAETDLTPAALSLDNAVTVRTFSKAWGMAGCRVGYALGAPPVLEWLRAASGPYNAAGPSLALCAARLSGGDEAIRPFIETVVGQRDELIRLLRELGARPLPSQANFVLARFGDAAALHAALGARGVAVRRFADPLLAGYLRITLPGEERAFSRLCEALRATVSPVKESP